MEDKLHLRVVAYLAACPPAIAGQEGHNQTYSVACNIFNGFRLTEEETYDYLRCIYNGKCQPPWSDEELRHKANQATKAQYSKPRGHLIGDGNFTRDNFKPSHFDPPNNPVQTIDPSTAIEVFLKGFSCSEADLYEASPIKPSDDFTNDGKLIVQHLFKVGEIVNFVTLFKIHEQKDKSTKAVPFGYGESVERNELIDNWGLGMSESEAGGWLRMNPMTGNGVGDNDVINHRHILLEFDSIPLDLQLHLFARLPLPISCIMTSGGKSLHAWVRADSADATCYRDDAAMLLKMLSRFGLDAKNKNPSRLSRLPGVTRKIGATGDGRQRLLYLNPSPLQRPIL